MSPFHFSGGARARNVVLRLALTWALLAVAEPVFAQPYILPMNDLSRLRWEAAGVGRQAGVHSTALPVLAADVDLSGVEGLTPDTSEYYYTFTRKLFGSHLVELDKPGLSLRGDILIDFAYGKETDNDFGDKRNLFTNTRGFALSAKIGGGVYVYTDFTETQSRFGGYIDHYVDSLGVVPGSGRVKPFGTGAYDFGVASGYVGGRVTPWLDLMAGHHRAFIGAGERSLLWSDASFHYPFASYTLRPFKGKVQYRYTLAMLQSLERLPLGETPESIFERSHAAQHYLSFKPTSDWEIGLFEATVRDAFDDSTGTRKFSWDALAPLPLFNPLKRGMETGETKSIIGLNAVWQPLDAFSIYGQWVVGDDDFEKTGHQIGARAFRLLGRVDLRVEYNSVDLGVYGVPTDEAQYAHFNQPLAHPLNSGFEEFFAEATYYHSRIYATVGWMAARGHAENPELADTQTDLLNARIAYVFNPFSNLELYAGFTHRSENRNTPEYVNAFYYFGLRTNLRNLSTKF